MRNPKNNNEIYTITEALNATYEETKAAVSNSAGCSAIGIFSHKLLKACKLYEEALSSMKCECTTQPKESFHDPACYCENDYICIRYVYRTCSICNDSELDPIASKALADAKAL